MVPMHLPETPLPSPFSGPARPDVMDADSCPSAPETAGPRLAFVCAWPDPSLHEADRAIVQAEWVRTCYQLTPRVERIGPWRVLLDLGRCTDGEASTAVAGLVGRLTTAQMHARAGVGASGVLAQLAAMSCTWQHPVRLLTLDDALAQLRRVPVRALLGWHPVGLVTPEIVVRLEHYGLRTLGHLLRLDELALRRQFGAVGSALAALAQGRDVRPLCPTPPPAELRIHQHFATPLTPDELLALLPQLAQWIAARLLQQGRRAGSLRVGVVWESGAVAWTRLVLRQATDSPTLLAAELRRTLLPLLAPRQLRAFATSTGARASHVSYGAAAERDALAHEGSESATGACAGDGVAALRVTLGECAPIVPVQTTFWRMRNQRTRAVADVAETLARRHGHPLLFRSQVLSHAAVFSEDRYTLDDHWTQWNERNERNEWNETLPLPPIGAEHATTHRTTGKTNVWQGVPQRLHWW